MVSCCQTLILKSAEYSAFVNFTVKLKFNVGWRCMSRLQNSSEQVRGSVVFADFCCHDVQKDVLKLLDKARN